MVSQLVPRVCQDAFDPRAFPKLGLEETWTLGHPSRCFVADVAGWILRTNIGPVPHMSSSLHYNPPTVPCHLSMSVPHHEVLWASAVLAS